MSASFRPVKEEWGISSDEFISCAALGDMLCSIIAEEIGSLYEQNTYSDLEVVWIENGHPFLDYIADESRFNILKFRELFPDEDENSLQMLISNMRNLVPSWRDFVDRTDGSLRFYID
jgi:hypothetical protein